MFGIIPAALYRFITTFVTLDHYCYCNVRSLAFILKRVRHSQETHDARRHNVARGPAPSIITRTEKERSRRRIIFNICCNITNLSNGGERRERERAAAGEERAHRRAETRGDPQEEITAELRGSDE